MAICVLDTDEQEKALKWEFGQDTAKPVLIKNKLAVISDDSSISKITLFEEFANKIKNK